MHPVRDKNVNEIPDTEKLEDGHAIVGRAF